MIRVVINWFEKHNKISWIITILIAIFIFYMSSLSFKGGPPGEGGVVVNSIIYHLLVYFALSLFFLVSLIKGRFSKPFLLLVIIISIIYGISDEIHQLFVPGRYFTISDILTNSAGTLFAGLLYSLIIKPKNNSQNSSNNNKKVKDIKKTVYS